MVKQKKAKKAEEKIVHTSNSTQQNVQDNEHDETKGTSTQTKSMNKSLNAEGLTAPTQGDNQNNAAAQIPSSPPSPTNDHSSTETQTTTLTQGDKQKNAAAQNTSSPPSPTNDHSSNVNDTQLRTSQTNTPPSQPAANQANPHDETHVAKDPENVSLPPDSESETEDLHENLSHFQDTSLDEIIDGDDNKCPICLRHCTASHMLLCDKCNKWIHYSCSKLPAYHIKTIEIASSEDKDFPYLCPLCQDTSSYEECELTIQLKKAEERIQMYAKQIENLNDTTKKLRSKVQQITQRQKADTQENDILKDLNQQLTQAKESLEKDTTTKSRESAKLKTTINTLRSNLDAALQHKEQVTKELEHTKIRNEIITEIMEEAIRRQSENKHTHMNTTATHSTHIHEEANDSEINRMELQSNSNANATTKADAAICKQLQTHKQTPTKRTHPYTYHLKLKSLLHNIHLRYVGTSPEVFAQMVNVTSSIPPHSHTEMVRSPAPKYAGNTTLWKAATTPTADSSTN